MRRKPGIFDPWRQEAPKAEPRLEKKPPPSDPTEVEVLHAVQFVGIRAGITAWVSSKVEEDRVLAARESIAALVLKFLASPVREHLLSQGIQEGWVDKPHVVHIGGHPHRISVETNSEGDRTAGRAIDNLALALRHVLQNYPSLEPLFTAARVRPFIK